MLIPERLISSAFVREWYFGECVDVWCVYILNWFWFSQTITEFSNIWEVVSIVLILCPWIWDTSAVAPPPPVELLSKLTKLPTLYFVPGLTIFNESIDPLAADSTIENWLYPSLDSVTKSLPEYVWDTLYGNVFLTKEEPLKSNQSHECICIRSHIISKQWLYIYWYDRQLT